MRMLLTGEAVNARQAYQHGLVSELVDVDALGEEKQGDLFMFVVETFRKATTMK